MTGEKRTAIENKVFNFDEVKAASKVLGITINDLMTSALSIAIKKYFVSQGDEKADFINIAVPVSMRWEAYDTFDSVKCENKFSPMAVNIPLIADA